MKELNKELTIEEKAKRYDEAIKLAKDSFNYPDYPGFIRADVVFPELKEREDEKIKNEIIAFVEQSIHRGGGTPIPEEKEIKWIAWLEKQGESIDIPVDAVLNSNENGLIAETIRYKKEQQGEQNTHLPSFDEAQGTPIVEQCEQKSIKEHDVCDFCEGRYGCINPCPVKLIEQKPTDKIEPKFKVGDWITDNNSTFQIVRVENEWYYADDGDKICFDVAHQYYHLWTIQDAKDGDVIFYDSGWTCIFKCIHGIWYSSYCFITADGEFHTGYKEHLINAKLNGNANPATKEQCDTLIKTMANAGYTFDFEKKELKKIEEPENYKKQVMSEMTDLVKDYITQKPTTWSEEDELLIRELESLVKQVWATAEHENDKDKIHKMSNLSFFLKTLKPQLKQEWSKEDEEIHRKCICAMRASACGFPEEEKFVEQVNNWLNSLKDRVQPQPKQEWSVEDEKIIVKLHNALEAQNYYDGASGKYIVPHKEEINWLKSLRPQKQWKPSDEQMKMLENAMSMGAKLDSLYNELKKLKEE